MKDKIWSEHDLRKRNVIAASAATSIATTKHPRQCLNYYIRDLIKYEIIPNYVFDDWTDDKIRQLAIQNLSPPKRLSKAANFDNWNKFPLLYVSECIMLLINVEPETPIRTQSEGARYNRILKLVKRCQQAKIEPFTGNRIVPAEFIGWAGSIGEDIPEGWQPVDVSPKHSEQDVVNFHEQRYEEAVKAAILLLGEGSRPRQIRNDVISRIRMAPDEFPACHFCGSDETLLRSIRKGGGNPLEDPRYLTALQELGK